MGEDKKTIEVSVEKAEISFEFEPNQLIGGVRNFFIESIKRRQFIKDWSKMSEDEQRIEVTRCEDEAEQLVHHIINAVAAGGYDVIHAELDKFTVKDGGVTIVAKGVADDGAVMSLNHTGKKLMKIVVVDERQFDMIRDDPKIDADQPSLLAEEVDEEAEAVASQPDDVFPEGDDVIDAETGEYVDAEVTAQPDPEPEPKPKAKTLTAKKDKKIDIKKEVPAVEPKSKAATKAKKGAAKKTDAKVVELVPQDGVKTEAMDEKAEAKIVGRGSSARQLEMKKDANPYDEGSLESNLWLTGFDQADTQIDQLTQAGYDAAFNKEDITSCKWSAGTIERKSWMKGFETAVADSAVS